MLIPPHLYRHFVCQFVSCTCFVSLLRLSKQNTTRYVAQTNLFPLTILKARIQTKLLTGFVSSEASLLGLQRATFWLSLYTVWSLCAVCILTASCYKDNNHILLGLTHMTSFYLNCLFKDIMAKYSHIVRFWGLTSTYEF